jgi:hypothetical protein
MSRFEISGFNVIASDLGDSEYDFWIKVQVDISEVNDFGAETFDINVVGTDRLIRIVGDGEYRFGRGLIISNRFIESEVRDVLKRLIEGIDANTFEELCNGLEKYFRPL